MLQANYRTASTVLAMSEMSICLSVCLSVKRLNFDKTKETSAHFLTNAKSDIGQTNTTIVKHQKILSVSATCNRGFTLADRRAARVGPTIGQCKRGLRTSSIYY